MLNGMSEGSDSSLVDSLLRMVDNPELSDVILVCKDGVRVHACRMLLAARSVLFKQLLLDGTTEGFAPKRPRTVELPGVTSSVLVIILKFLYADVLCDDDIRSSNNFGFKNGGTMSYNDEGFFFRLDWEFLLKVVTVARFLRVERLEKVIIERLWNDVPKLDSDHELEFFELSAVARSLSTLCEYDTLWNAGKVKLLDGAGIICCANESTYVKSIEAICIQLMQILVFYELRATTLFYLSKKAFQFYLAKRRRISSARGESWDWDIEQYVRLREIFIWCAVRAPPGETDLENLDLLCLPEPHIAERLLQDSHDHLFCSLAISSNFRESRESFMRRIDRIVKDDLNQFLPIIDLGSIHPKLLVNIIEPLGLIEHKQLFRIFSSQAMRGSTRVKKHAPVWNWVGYGLYSLTTSFSDNLTFTVSVESSSDEKICLVAGAELPMYLRERYEWEIVVTPHGLLEFENMSILEIGFCRLRHGESLVRQMAKYAPSCLSDDRRSSVLRISGEEEFYEKGAFQRSLGVLHGWPRTLWNRPLKVMLNREDGICSFSSAGPEGRESQSTFRVQNAEDEVFYPVVHIEANDIKRMYDHEVPGSTLRPHYDRLTVKIQRLKGFGENA